MAEKQSEPRLKRCQGACPRAAAAGGAGWEGALAEPARPRERGLLLKAGGEPGRLAARDHLYHYEDVCQMVLMGPTSKLLLIRFKKFLYRV